MGTCEFLLVEGEHGVPVAEGSDIFCTEHLSFEWRVCKGCGGSALRECSHADPQASPQVCREPLCGLCTHQGQGHGREEPTKPLSPPKGQDAINALRADLTENIKATLVYAGQQQIPLDAAAALILQNMETHMILQTLAGMAANPPDSVP